MFATKRRPQQDRKSKIFQISDEAVKESVRNNDNLEHKLTGELMKQTNNVYR